MAVPAHSCVVCHATCRLPSKSDPAQHRMQLCTVVHMQGLSARGKVADAPPLYPVTEAIVRAAETREGTLVLLPDAIQCGVSFTQGAERQVLLGVAGLPQVGFVGLSQSALAFHHSEGLELSELHRVWSAPDMYGLPFLR